MRLPGDLGWLTYCLNIHPTQSWAEARATITGPLAAVKAALAPNTPFAAGLRFSAQSVRELGEPAARADLKRILADANLVPVTVNGFPYGPFHGTRVKEDVYQPDWLAGERLAYTCALADLMADIAAGDEPVSLSTVPGSFKPLAVGHEAEIADNLLRAAAHCVALRDRTGVTVALAIEPEPCCFLETIAESVDFFRARLFSDAAARRLAELTGLSESAAAEALPRHLGLCYDVCHAAVEFEDAAGSVAALQSAGVPIHKLQLSAALRVPEVNPQARAALAAFDEPVYLHQVVSRRDGRLDRLPDLGPALARGAAADGEEWRVHFHVPLFVSDLGAFRSTQDFLAEILALHRRAPISPHLEVETYTWDVLPPALRHGPVQDAVARELGWVLDRLAPVNLRTALRLGRVSNLPTVWTNALTGAVLAGGAGAGAVLAAAAALSLFYIGGMWLNDAFDAEIDARERAGRPIPHGDADRGTVFAGGFAFLGAGVVAGFALGLRAGAIALALAAAIVAYDWLHKRIASGPVIMGAVRFLAYAFGGAAAGGFTLPLVLGGFGLFAHVVGLTYAARQEAYDRIDRAWPLAVLAVPLAYSLWRAAAAPAALPFWLALAVATAVALRFLFRRSRGDVPRAVVTLIAAISLYDATLIAAAGHFGLGLLAALGFVLTLALQRLVSGT